MSGQPIAALLKRLWDANEASKGGDVSLASVARWLEDAIAAQCSDWKASDHPVRPERAEEYLARSRATLACIHDLQGAVALGTLLIGEWFTWVPSAHDCIEFCPGPCRVIAHRDGGPLLGRFTAHTTRSGDEVEHDSRRMVIRIAAPAGWQTQLADLRKLEEENDWR